MFYDNYVKFCVSVGKKPSAVALDIGLNKSTVSNWKNRGTSPTDATAQRIADYFGISVEELMSENEKEPAPLSENELDYDKWLNSLSHDELLKVIAKATQALQERR